MKTNWKAALAGAALVALSGSAVARDSVSLSISLGVPAPVYFEPPVVAYYYPAPVYVPRLHAYYAAPAYVSAPAVIYYRSSPRWSHGYRHWERHRRMR